MKISRRHYTVLARLLLPLAFIRLVWRSLRQPAYRRHWSERLGFYRERTTRPVIWLHAVSVGETRAATALVNLIRQHYPDYQLLITHMTPTGRETAIDALGPDIVRCYLPYDLPGADQRFLAHFCPRIGLLLETEIWPNLISLCADRSIPLLLVNARLSEKSAAGYQRYQPLVGQSLRSLALIATQTAKDAQRLKDLGAKEVVVAGNLKFDAAQESAEGVQKEPLRHLWSPDRPVWLAASTRPGEEKLLLDLLPRLPIPGLLLVLVPRHPQRFKEVAMLLTERRIPFRRRSENLPVPDEMAVLLGDSMGEMECYYRSADVALIGGSLLPYGGQNLIEATAVGCPVIVGPHTYNFLDAAEFAIASGAALRVQDAAELLTVLPSLMNDLERRRQMGEAGLRFTLQHRGAAKNILALMNRFLPQTA
jgi:3-deoxy-D-manno-octulosonic-acid transferase